MNLQHMIPYANPTYFIWLMVGLLPMMLVLLFKQKRWQWYQTLLTLAVLYVSFGGEYWQQGLALIGYVVYQTLLVYGYYQHRQRANTSGVFLWCSGSSDFTIGIEQSHPLSLLDMPH